MPFLSGLFPDRQLPPKLAVHTGKPGRCGRRDALNARALALGIGIAFAFQKRSWRIPGSKLLRDFSMFF
jgi:hypothetical protein